MAEAITMIQMQKKQNKSLSIALTTYCYRRTQAYYSSVILKHSDVYCLVLYRKIGIISSHTK